MTTPAQRLKTEIETDPLGRGYSGMTDRQVADDLNTAYRTRTRDTLDAAEIFEHIDVAEFTALTSSNKARVDRVLSLGASVRVGPGTNARSELISTLGGGSASIAKLASILDVPTTRADELSLGVVTQHTVNDARNP